MSAQSAFCSQPVGLRTHARTHACIACDVAASRAANCRETRAERRCTFQLLLLLLLLLRCRTTITLQPAADISARVRLQVSYQHHHGSVAGEGRRVVAPRSTARLQRSPVGRVESFRSWSSHLFRGRPGGRRHVRSGGRLSDTLMWS